MEQGVGEPWIWKSRKTKILRLKFDHWYSMALEMVKAVGRKESKPRIMKCFQQHRDNAASEDINSYWEKSVAVAVMDNLTATPVQRTNRLSTHANISILLPSGM